MDCDTLSSSCGLKEKSTQKISISDHMNSLQNTNMKSDSFIVDMERFSHPPNKDVTPNSRITLQRSLSRKGSQRGAEKKKISPSKDDERDTNVVAASSPRAASTPEKPMVVAVGATDHPINPQVHHQITIMTGTTTAAATFTATDSRLGGRRFSFRRASTSWTIEPRRILFFFATLSSIGTILLIYFTLSMGKLSGDDNALK